MPPPPQVPRFSPDPVQFEYTASHITGKENRAADALYHNRLHLFLSLIPQTPPPTLVYLPAPL